MKITAQDFHTRYAPSKCDLRVYLRANGEPEKEPGEFEQMLFRLGKLHESKHLADYPNVVRILAFDSTDRFGKTKEFVAAGAEVIYQPVLKASISINGIECELVGEPDFLIRESSGYVIRDVKLVRRVDGANHPEVILQLQLYGLLFEKVFGSPPSRLEVFNGKGELVIVPNVPENVLAHLREVAELKMLTTAPYHPVGWSKCTGCGFHDRCWDEAKAANDVALVVGIDQGLAIQLHKQGIKTIRRLVDLFDETLLSVYLRPKGAKMEKVGKAAEGILQSAQALLTNTETVLSTPAIPKHENYVMFDLEGLPPQMDELGKIYLWGMQVFGNVEHEFQPAVSGFGENGDEDGWHEFLRKANAIFQKHGDIPFVHWSHYEKTQINEYIRRYGDPDSIAARVLKNLLDLLPVARDSVVLPIYSYSLKEIEKYVGFKRTQTEFGGSWSMAKYIEATETEDLALRSQVMDQILLYNEEDLAATWAVFRWLKGKCAAVEP